MGKTIDEELLKEFERLVQEGGIDVSANPCIDLDLEPQYNCSRDIHKWKYYVGFHMEQYWYCELCDLKDKQTRYPPMILNLNHSRRK